MKRAVVLSRSAEARNLVARSLSHSYRLVFVETPEAASEAIAVDPPDALLIDLENDQKTSYALVKAVRRQAQMNSVIVLFLSRIREASLVVRAFDVGGDDLVWLPVEPEELRARIEYRSRHRSTPNGGADFFWSAGLRFSLAVQRVICVEDERDLGLTPNEFKILYYLARRAPSTVSRYEILQEVWGSELHVVARTVDKHICSLRRKLAGRSRCLTSIAGQGYRFEASAPGTILLKESCKDTDSTIGGERSFMNASGVL